METIDENTMAGLDTLFDDFVPKEYPYVDTNSKAYHYLQGAIKALDQAGVTGDARIEILMGLTRDKKSELEGWEYVNIVCGDIFHV